MTGKHAPFGEKGFFLCKTETINVKFNMGTIRLSTSALNTLMVDAYSSFSQTIKLADEWSVF